MKSVRRLWRSEASEGLAANGGLGRGPRFDYSSMLLFSPTAYRLTLRPLLFALPPEVAQGMAQLALRRRYLWRAAAPWLRVRDDRLSVEWCGHRVVNPVGLAAGYDKDGDVLPSLAALGFGYLVAGTVTESPRTGNPRPRLLRYRKKHSLVNALGFPSKGLEYAAQSLERSRDAFSGTPVAVSVSGTTVAEIVRCHRRLEPLVDAVELNISSPNTAGLRVFHAPSALSELIESVNEQRSRPLMVKLPPYPSTRDKELQEAARERALALARVCVDTGVDAMTVANSTPTEDSRLSTGAGGLSGQPVFAEMLRMVSHVRSEVGGRLAINACGGIFTGEDAWKALEAGATTVQLYTGLVYRGPGVVGAISRELLAIMEREGGSYPSSVSSRA